MRVGVLIAAAAIASVARADASLSVLEDTADGCHWTRVNALTGESKNIARVAPSCVGVTSRWSPDTSRVLFDRLVSGDQELSVVSADSGVIQKLWVPPIGEFQEFGFDRKNVIIAITANNALFGWEFNISSGWLQTASTKKVRYYSDCGNVDLRAFSTTGAIVEAEFPIARETPLKQRELPPAIRAVLNPNPDMGMAWRKLASRFTSIYARRQLNHDCGRDSDTPFGAFVIDKSGAAVELGPRYADTIQLSGKMLLVYSSNDKLARVYDVTNMSVVLERKNVASATFWPTPRKP